MTPAAQRKAWLGGFLVVTLGAVVWVSQSDTPAPGVETGKAKPRVNEREARPAPATLVAGNVNLGTLERVRADRAAVTDLFGAKSFVPTPPPVKPAPKVAVVTTVTPPPPAPPPQAPPVPYAFMGRMSEAGKQQAVFLSKADRLFVARVGDTVEGNYKIQSVDGASLRLLYLPLNQSQTVAMSSGTGGSGIVAGATGTSLSPAMLQQQNNPVLQNFNASGNPPENQPVENPALRGTAAPAASPAPAPFSPVSGIEGISPSAMSPSDQ